jgi:hypothetical protein
MQIQVEFRNKVVFKKNFCDLKIALCFPQHLSMD